MVAKGQKLTGAGLRNQKKAVAVRKLTASGVSLADARRRVGTRVQGSNPKATATSRTKSRSNPRGNPSTLSPTRFGGNYERFADASSRVALAVGVGSIGTSVVLGRSIVHPATGPVGLNRPVGVTLPLRNPHTGTVALTTAVGQDVIGFLTGKIQFAGQPAGFGGRLRSAGSAIGYNAASAFTAGSAGFYLGPAAVGVGIRIAERLSTPIITGALGMLERATDAVGIRA